MNDTVLNNLQEIRENAVMAYSDRDDELDLM